MESAKKNSVLIVDDEKSSLEVLISILNPEYIIYMAKSGSAALKIADTYQPDLILLDVIMPVMDGFEVLETLKASGTTQHIPVIFITGLDRVEDEEKGLAMGATDFIHKPFSARIVQSRVRQQIQIINQIRAIERYAQAAETANRTKSAFLANMSHEIRTPLNAIIGIAEIHFQNESLSQELQEAFGRIFNSGDLLLGIINDILDMSKIEAGKLELILAQYDVASLINDTVFLNMIKYESKPIEFVLNIDERVPSMLFGDELRIKQILNNILSNAFKYTNAGMVEFSVAAEAAEDADGDVRLVFRVRDTGHGMTPEQVSKLFDEYARFDVGANRTTEGTGLGMSITQNLIRLMRGEILVESTPEKGSLFTVSLPQRSVGAPVLGSESAERLQCFRTNYGAKRGTTRITRSAIHFGKVLVVDDVGMNLYVAKGMLLPYGLHIDTAASGAEAIEKVQQNTYDLVFMDHMMPKMDGMEATQEIRKLGGKYQELPIIALTANAISGMREMFLENGFNDFVSKPINIQELDTVLKKWMSPEKITQKAKPEADAAAGNDGTGGCFWEELCKIEEIKTEIGLSRFSDQRDMYRNVLAMFQKRLVTDCEHMREHMTAGDMKAFLIVVHSTKSLLATIGANSLSETAFALETGARNNELDSCARRYPEFEKRLLALQQRLSALFPAAESALEKGPGDMKTLRENLRKALTAAGEYDNIAGKEYIQNLLPYDFGGRINDLLKNAMGAFEEYQYANAAEWLERAARESGSGD